MPTSTTSTVRRAPAARRAAPTGAREGRPAVLYHYIPGRAVLSAPAGLPACTGSGACAPELREQAHDPGQHHGHPVRQAPSERVQRPAALTDQALRSCARLRRRRPNPVARAVGAGRAAGAGGGAAGGGRRRPAERRQHAGRRHAAALRLLPRVHGAQDRLVQGAGREARVSVLGSQPRAVSIRQMPLVIT